MFAAAPSSLLRSALVVVACALAGCTERKPLAETSASASGTSGGPGTESAGTSGGPTTDSAGTEAEPTTAGGTPGTTSDGPQTSTASPATATTMTDTGDPGGGDPSGAFLLAVSTTLAPDLPLQFIATSALTEMNGQTSLHLELQPLTLDQGQVTTPRVPIGDPLVFDMIPVVDGAFELDAGVVEVTGAANPVTGSDITASLTLAGTLKSDDFYCGTVDGELTEPLMAPLTGSTFAAVRIAGPEDLPLDVSKNCAGDTVTDS